jgi:beta-lactamase superfamily II metal-dependent hydrolase
MINLPTIIDNSYFDDGKVVVFIESIEKIISKINNSTYTIIFDFLIFPQSKNNFISKTNLNFNDNSMLEISEVTFEKFGIPREGSFYILPEEFISETEWLPVEGNDDFGSNHLAFKSLYNVRPVYFENAVGYLNFVTSLDFGNDYLFDNVAKPFFDNIKPQNIAITVYNVGQGNWNEINFNNKVLMVYDFGSSSNHFSNNIIRTIIHPDEQRMHVETILGDGSLKKILIISHWDTDHYIGIKTLTDIQIQSLDFCLIPNRIENNTTLNVVNRLIDNTLVIPIEMNTRIAGGGSSRLTVEYNSAFLKLYKGTKCSNRNKRGILLTLHHNNTDFIFPGDHHYNQIDTYIRPLCLGSDLNLVIPHHGGNAGRYKLLDNFENGENGIISTNGRYGHPKSDILNQINLNFRNMHRTDLNNHFHLTLY